MFLSFGRAMYRWRWPVIVAWAILLAAAFAIAPRVFDSLSPGGFSSPQLEAQQADDQLAERFGYSPGTLIVVFEDPSGALKPLDPRFQADVEQSLAKVRTIPEVAFVRTPLESPRQISPDGTIAYAVVALKTDVDPLKVGVPAVDHALTRGSLKVTLTGAPVFYGDIYEVTESDLRRAETISFPFAAIALLLVFGTVVAAALPGIVGGAAVVLTVAIMVLLTQVMDLSIFSLNLVTMLGLGLGIDYSLFVVSRFREEISAGRSTEHAVAQSIATAGRAVLYSGSTVLLGLLGLLFFDFVALRSLGVSGALVVGVCVLAALTLLPAVMSVLGHRVDALNVRDMVGRLFGRPVQTKRVSLEGAESTGFWASLARWVMAHPVITLVPVLILLLGLGAPFLRVQLGAPDASILPRSVQSRQGYDLLTERWGKGELSPLLVVLRTSDGGSPVRPESVANLYELGRKLQADDRVARVDSIVTIDSRLTLGHYQLTYLDADQNPNRMADAYARGALQATVSGDTVLMQVESKYGQTDDRSKQLVRDVRATGVPGFEVKVGGVTAGTLDYTEALYRGFPLTAGFVVVAIYFVLLLTFRSVLLPIKAVLMNVLSITASYGALVVVFQEGAFSQLLQFEPLGFVEASLPIILFCVLFGLSMDYEVFLLSRVKESYDAGESNTDSVAHGIQHSGRIITSAAAIVVLVSSSFMAGDIVLTKALGLGTALAVLLDATVVRALLVPATMRLLGDWNWWAPRWMQHRRQEAASDA